MKQKVLSLLLVLAFVVGSIPTSVLAQDSVKPDDTKIITSVAPLEETVATQQIEADSDILPNLPETLNAVVETTTWSEGETSVEDQEEPQMVYISTSEISTVDVAVTWTSEAEFTATEAMSFTYEASLMDDTLTLAEGISFPTITVEVISKTSDVTPEPESKPEPSSEPEPVAQPIILDNANLEPPATPTSSWADNAASAFGGGDGTAEDPYQIENGAQLAYLSKLVSEDTGNDDIYDVSHYVLTSTIDLSAHAWVPIESFSGTFDGQGNTITGLTLHSGYEANTNLENAGLFGALDRNYHSSKQYNAVVKNIVFANVNIYMTNTANKHVGALAGYVSSYAEETNITNISVSGEIIGTQFVGGVVGTIGDEGYGYEIPLSHITNNANVTAIGGGTNLFVGGITGRGGILNNCENTGAIQGNASAYLYNGYNVGGISGGDADVYNSTNNGTVTTTLSATADSYSVRLGGIMGRGKDDGIINTIYNSYNTGDVSLGVDASVSLRYSDPSIGGIVGRDAHVMNTYNTGNLTATGLSVSNYTPGQIIGYVNRPSISVTNNYWSDANLPAISDRNTGYDFIVSGLATFDETDGTLTALADNSIIGGKNQLKDALNTWVSQSQDIFVLPYAWTGNINAPVHITAQNATGTVTDNTGAPTANAAVKFMDMNFIEVITVTTNASGVYTVNDLAPGNYIIEVNASNMLEQMFRVSYNDGSWVNDVKLIKLTPFTNNTITTIEHLAYLSNQVNSGATTYEGETITLANDLDLSGYYWTPIGNDPALLSGASFNMMETTFAGSFDGGKNKISGLKVWGIDNSIGLFGSVGYSLVSSSGSKYDPTITVNITDLTIENPTIIGSPTFAGAVSGMVHGKTQISEVVVTNPNINVNNDSDAAVGGLVGILNSGIVLDSRVTGGSIYSPNGDIGGIAGTNAGYNYDYSSGSSKAILITNAENYGTSVTTLTGVAGGIIGDASSTSSADTAHSTTIRDNGNSGVITGTHAGGIVGKSSISIINNTNSGEIIGGTAGGIVADISSDTDINNNVNRGDVSNEGFEASGSYYYNTYIGGVAGKSSTILSNNSNLGNLTLNGSGGIGGIVGELTSTGGTYNNYNTGTITANMDNDQAFVGGIIGYTHGGDIHNNYSTEIATLNGSLSSNSGHGAILGYAVDSDNTVGNNYVPTTELPMLGYQNGGETTGIYENNAMFNKTTHALTAFAGQTAVSNNLLDALNLYITENTDILGLKPWVSDNIDTPINGGYPIFAPPVDYSATITNQSNTKVSDALVTLYDYATGDIAFETTTDASGNVDFVDVTTSTYIVEITKDGYAFTTFIQNIVEDTEKQIKIIEFEAIPDNNEISTIGQLANIANEVEAAQWASLNYTLANDIVLTGYYWDPLPSFSHDNNYHISLNGNGNKIIGMTISSVEDNQGFFSTSKRLYISNITFSDVNVTGGMNVGALVGGAISSRFYFTDVRVDGDIKANSAAGGLIGKYQSGTGGNSTDYSISNCHVNVNVTANGYAYGGNIAGGMIGSYYAVYDTSKITTPDIQNSSVSGNITADYYAGGFIGAGDSHNSRVYAKNVINNATVSGERSGGFAGYLRVYSDAIYSGSRYYGHIDTFTNNGDVFGNYLSAGIIGDGSAFIYNSINTGTITSESRAAGFLTSDNIGYSSANGGVYNSANLGEINGSTAYGIAYLRNDYTTENVIANCWNVGTLNASQNSNENAISPNEYQANNHYLASAGGAAIAGNTEITTKEALSSSLNTYINGLTQDQLNEFNADLITWTTNASNEWPIHAIPVTITFNANGAEGDLPEYTGAQLYTGGVYTAPENTTLSLTGHNFIGWTLDPSASPITVYEVGQAIPLETAQVTLYAVWGVGIENAIITTDDTYVYSGEEQSINYTVSVNGVTLTKDVDFEVDSIQVSGEITPSTIVDANDYTITISGLGIYNGTTTKDLVTVSPLPLEIDSTNYEVSKVYDDTANAPSDLAATIETTTPGVTVEVTGSTEFYRVTGYDSNTTPQSDAGTHLLTLELGDFNVESGLKKSNYVLERSAYVIIHAMITPFVITSIGNGDVAISKIYDATTAVNLNTAISGKLALLNASNEEAPGDIVLNYSPVSFSQKDVGTNITVTVDISAYASTNDPMSNYDVSAIDLDTDYSFTDGVINVSPFTVVLPTQPKLKVNSSVNSLKQVIAPVAINGITPDGGTQETPSGEMELYSADTYEAADILTDADLEAYSIGETATIYWEFTLDSSAINNNYESSQRGSVEITFVDGDPQNITFTDSAKTIAYGDTYTNNVTVTTTNNATVTNGGAITYSVPENNGVATIDASSGEVTAIGVGSTTVTVNAAAVPGVWATGENSYTVTVTPKDIEVTVTAEEREYGSSNPTFEGTVAGGMLVTGDTYADLGMSYSTSATETSNVGTYDVTGSATNPNYYVTVLGQSKLTIVAKDIFMTGDDRAINVVVNVGTFTEPTFSVIANETIDGTIKYTGYANKAAIEAELLTLAKAETLLVDYTFTAAANSNYSGTITGTITFTLVDILFENTSNVVVVDNGNLTYGATLADIIAYDVSDITASVGGSTVDGTYKLVVDDADFDGTVIPTAGVHNYKVVFNSSDDPQTYTDVEVLSGTFTVARLTAVLSWSNTELTYDGTAQKPIATVTNLVGSDTASVIVTGEQTNANINAYEATATSIDNSNYALPTDVTENFTIAQVQLTWGSNGTAQGKVYDGNTDAIEATAPTLSGIISVSGVADDVSVLSGDLEFDSANAGTRTVTAVGYTIDGTDAANYLAPISQPTFDNAVISQKPIAVTIEAKSKKFDEENPELTFTYDLNELVSGDGENDLAITLSTTATKTSNVGGDYPITGVSTSVNYAVSFTDAKLTVNKADFTVAEEKEVGVKYSYTGTEVTLPLTSYLPTIPGTITGIAITEATDTYDIITSTAFDLDNAEVKYSLASGLTVADKDKTAQLNAVVTSQNYTDITLTINITVTDKDQQSDFKFDDETIINGIKTITYGANEFTLAATGNGMGSTVSYASEDESVATIDENGKVSILKSGTTKITAYADETLDYTAAETSYTLVVEKAELIITADDSDMYESDELPELTLTYDGFVNDEDESILSTTPKAAVSIDGSTAGKFDITVIDIPDDSNYEITVVEGTLTVLEREMSKDAPLASIPDDTTSSTPVIALDEGSTFTDTDGKKVDVTSVDVRMSVTAGVTALDKSGLDAGPMDINAGAVKLYFEISMFADGIEVLPSGDVQIFIPYNRLAPLTKDSNIKILHLKSDNTYETITPDMLDGGIRFTADGLSPFLIYDVVIDAPVGPDSETDTPATGDTSNPLLLVVLITVSTIGIAFIAVKKRKLTIQK